MFHPSTAICGWVSSLQMAIRQIFWGLAADEAAGNLRALNLLARRIVSTMQMRLDTLYPPSSSDPMNDLFLRAYTYPTGSPRKEVLIDFSTNPDNALGRLDVAGRNLFVGLAQFRSDFDFSLHEILVEGDLTGSLLEGGY